MPSLPKRTSVFSDYGGIISYFCSIAQISTSVIILDFRFDWVEMILNIQEYYFQVDECSRPRILGMTASPVIRKGEILVIFLL